ncbi:MAG: DEAD/DEAH box helicase [Promethearchaeota archaeon]
MKLGQLFKPWEIRHLADRAKQFGYDNIFLILSTLGWKLEKKDLNQIEFCSLELALEKLGNVKGLDLTCIREKCEICKKLEEFILDIQILPKPKNQPWILDLSLYSWQIECINKWWDNGCKGIVKVVTAAGKTILALALISQLKNKRIYRNKDNLRIIIILPTISLLDQWYEELRKKLHLINELGVYYGEQKDDYLSKPIMLYLINSARKDFLNHSINIKKIGSDIFLILDECHRYGSDKNAKIFQAKYDFVLGLSATPERKQDYGFEKILEKKIGKIIYNYSYTNALKDNIIPPFKLIRLYVPLNSEEKTFYEEITYKLRKFFLFITNKVPKLKKSSYDFFKELSELKKNISDKELLEAIDNFTSLAIKRKEIIHNSEKKILAVDWLFENQIKSNERTLIFHERTDVADKIYELLKEKGYKVGIYHSNMNQNYRREELRRYKQNKYQILITCKALDEGLDVPSTNNGIIVASTASIRQRIQRIGRILRKSPGKNTSVIYSILIENLEDNIIDYDEIKEIERIAEKIENFYIKRFD